MILVPAVAKFRFKVSGIEIEGNDEPGVDVQYPWENIPRRHHDKQIEINAFYIDKYPVTNREFKKFLDATNYRPKDDHNFLRDWKNGSLSGRLGKEAGDMGIAGRCPRLRGVGRQATAARVGMAIRGARNGRARLSMGQRPQVRSRAFVRGNVARDAAARRCRCASKRRQPVWRNGHDRKHLAMDRRVPGRTYTRRHCSRWRTLSSDCIEVVLPRDHVAPTSTGSTCSWRRRKIARERLDFDVSWIDEIAAEVIVHASNPTEDSHGRGSLRTGCIGLNGAHVFAKWTSRKAFDCGRVSSGGDDRRISG